MANWLVKGLKKFAGIAETTGKVLLDGPLDDMAVAYFAPSFSPQWRKIQDDIHAVQVKNQGIEGMGAVKKAEVMALAPESLALANDAIAWTGKKMIYDMALVSDAIDMSVALEKKIKDALASAKLVDIDAPAL